MSVIVFANVTSTPAAKRLPYCDHVVALSSEGRIVEQGTYDKLNRSGGYVSSFDLPPPDWDFAPEKHVYEAPPKYTERAAADKVTEEDMQAEANRRTGDASIYLFYVRSVGWTATLIFVVSITIFIFGQLFPSEYSLSDSSQHDAPATCRILYLEKSVAPASLPSIYRALLINYL
jgi:hypothetical protein